MTDPMKSTISQWNFDNIDSEKLENPRVDKFVATYDLSKLNQVNINSLKRSTTVTEIEAVVGKRLTTANLRIRLTAQFYPGKRGGDANALQTDPGHRKGGPTKLSLGSQDYSSTKTGQGNLI